MKKKIEVEKIEREMEREMRMDEEIDEDVDIVNDLGKKKLGNKGEEEIKERMKNLGGLENNEKQIRIVKKIENR